MPNTHRGTPTGNNHRPTPRVNRAIQKYFKIPEGAAQQVINEHRSGMPYLDDDYYTVNYPHAAYALGSKYDPNQHGHPDEDNIGTRIDYIPSAINAAIRTRKGTNPEGYSSPYEYPPTVEGP